MLKLVEEVVNTGLERVASAGIPSSVAETLKVVEEQRAELVKQYRQQLTDYGNKSLIDFNYTVKVIMGSDTSSVVKMPVVNLELFVKDVNSTVERVVLELNKEELKTFIDQLVQIQKVKGRTV